ncbi:Uncharacterised protein [Mycobacterium tuberculosis]|nr:Uncharacterised protein [Mycobacterium tuberculosis]
MPAGSAMVAPAAMVAMARPAPTGPIRARLVQMPSPSANREATGVRATRGRPAVPVVPVVPVAPVGRCRVTAVPAATAGGGWG